MDEERPFAASQMRLLAGPTNIALHARRCQFEWPLQDFPYTCQAARGFFFQPIQPGEMDPKIDSHTPFHIKTTEKNPNSCWHLVFHSVLGQVAANFGGGRSTLAI